MTAPTTPSTPADAPELTLDDMRASGAVEILNDSADDHPLTLLHKLEEARQALEAAGQDQPAFALQVLMWAFSMRLDGQSATAPLGPAMRRPDGAATAAPENLSVGHIAVLAQLVPLLTVAKCRARLADLVCLRGEKRQRRDFAVAAIDSYMAEPIEAKTWHAGGKLQWDRALHLALKFSAGVGTRLDEVELALVNAFTAACGGKHDYEPLWYSHTLRQGTLRDAPALAQGLEQLGQRLVGAARSDAAIATYEEAAFWFERTGRHADAAAMLNQRAAAAESKGDAASSGFSKQAFYEDALRYYRAVDGKFYDSLGVRASIVRVQGKIEAAGHLTVGEMGRVSSEPFDVTGLVADAINKVRDLDVMAALNAFVELDHIPSRAYHVEVSQENSRTSVFGSLIESARVTGEGRTIAKIPALTGDADHDARVHELKAMENCAWHAGMVAEVAIGPALSQVYLEHALTLADFRGIAQGSPIVPLDHADVIARGLYAGYQGDFTVALHILLPQFEHIVRTILKAHGAITTTTDVDGIAMEVGLSALVDRPQMVPAFGEDLTFAIRSLMCAQVGANLRNDIAHGLANTLVCNSTVGMYTWWLIFKLIFTYHMWVVSQPAGDDSAELA